MTYYFSHKKLFAWFFIFLFLCLVSISGQNNFQHPKDSLLNIIPTLEGEEKLNAYTQLFFIFYTPEELDAILPHLEKAINEAGKQKKTETESMLRRTLLTIFVNNNRRDLFLERVQSDLDFFASHEDWNRYNFVHLLLFDVYISEKQQGKALEGAQKLLDETKKRNDQKAEQAAFYGLAWVYQNMDRDNEALSLYQEIMDTQKNDRGYSDYRRRAFENSIIILTAKNQFSESLKVMKNLKIEIDRYVKENKKMKLNHAYLWSGYYRGMTDMLINTGHLDEAEVYCDSAEMQLPEDERNMENITYFRASIKENRKEYPGAYDLYKKSHEYALSSGNAITVSARLRDQARILCLMGQGEKAHSLYEEAFHLNDSIKSLAFNAQIDEMRTTYEVDKITVEKDRNRSYFLFFLTLCTLLLILLSAWIYYSKQLDKKNRAMVQQIRSFQQQKEQTENNILLEISSCPDDKIDKLCLEIHHLLIKEKAYLNPLLSRDEVISMLDTNKRDFIEAFQKCFKTTFPACINDLRLKESLMLLEKTDLSMVEISGKSGFGTPRTFYRQFQEKYNMSPSAYKKFSREDDNSLTK